MWWIITITLTLMLLIIHPLILRKYTKNTLCLNTDRLHLQYYFQIALLLPFIFSVFLMIWAGSDYPSRWDSIGFNAFLDIQKLPLGILALSPILAAFVVYAHRSLQTENQIKTAEKQLEEAQKKNKVDIYFSQRKFIIERLENIKIPDYDKIDNADYIYDTFREFDDYNDRKNMKLFKFINSKLDDTYTSFLYIKEHTKNLSNEEINHPQLMVNLVTIQNSIMSIIDRCGLKRKEFKIKDTINNYRTEYNTKMISNFTNSDNYYKPILNSLLYDVWNEIFNLHNSLYKLFTIILLDEDISEFLPNLEKINLTQLP